MADYDFGVAVLNRTCAVSRFFIFGVLCLYSLCTKIIRLCISFFYVYGDSYYIGRFFVTHHVI